MASKGIMEFTAGQTLRIILVLIFIVGAGAMFATFVSVNDNENMRSIICKVTPDSPACKDINTPASDDYKAAKMSTEALVCAVNSVTQGSQYYGSVGETACKDYYGSQATLPTDINQLTPEQMVNDYFMEEVYIHRKSGIKTDKECEEQCTDPNNYEKVCGEIPGCIAYSGRYHKRNPLLVPDRSVRDDCECTRLVPMKPYVTCEQTTGGTECTVSNFNLPQTITEAEDWIPYYGDPKYLVYWQKFPMSEDTWTFHDSWWMYGLIIAASAIPIGKIGAITGKAAVSEAEKIAMGGIKNAIKRSATVDKYIARNLIKDAEVNGRRQIAEAIKKDLKDKLLAAVGKPGAAFRQGGKVVTGLGAIATLSAADVLDSWIGKLTSHKNSILFKRAGDEEPEQFNMEKDVPVIIRYKRHLFRKSTPTLVLASPCYLSSMKVKRSDEVICGYYANEDGDITCNEPAVKNDKYPLCTEPDTYLRTNGGSFRADPARDPIVREVLDFADGKLPEFMQVGNNRATVLLSDGVYAVFDTRPGHTLEDAYLIFDTGSGVTKVPIVKSDTDTSAYLEAEATYKDAKIFLRFDDFDKKCIITADGEKYLESYNPKNIDGTRNFAFMPGAGCLGYAGVYERCEKSERESDTICKMIEDMNDRAFTYSDMMGTKNTVYTNFRYGDNWSISALGSPADSGMSTHAGYWVELTENNGDYYPDKIGISSGIINPEFGNTIHQLLEFMDTGTGIEFETYTMTDCRMPDAVIVTDFDKRSVEEDNYCYAQPTGGSIALNIAGQAVTVGGTIAAGFLSGGTAIALVAATGATGGALQVGAELSTKWPNAGGG